MTLSTMTFNLVEGATESLTRAHEITGDTRTDCVNVAVQWYATIVAAARETTPTRMTWDDATGAILVVYPGRSRGSWLSRWRRAKT